MKIIISGLSGTGKTTICKNVCENSNLEYVNDYAILKKHNISFDENSKITDKDYSKFILDYIEKKDNVVIDLCHTITPAQAKKTNAVIYFLGFEDNVDLLSKLYSKKNNIDINESEKIVSEFIEISKLIKKQCENSNLPYIEINKDREKIIEKITNEILKKIKLKNK